MRLVPRTVSEKIAFFNAKLSAFAEHAADIGLTETQVEHLQTLVEAAHAAQIAQGEAFDAARSATMRLNAALDALGETGAAMIGVIRSTAETTNDPNVYVLAQLPPPKKGSPTAEPGTPDNLVVDLSANGLLQLRWTCRNPKGSAGTVYQLHRRVGDGAFEYLGMTGSKQFLDATIPAGATQLEYQIQAIRSTKVGVKALFPVCFGTNGAALPPGMRLPTVSRRMMIAA